MTTTAEKRTAPSSSRHKTRKLRLGFERPTRGAVRLSEIQFDPALLESDVHRLEDIRTWEPVAYGEHWDKIELLKDDYRDEALDRCPAIQRVLATFPARPLAAGLARLGPGGWIKEHRDISGGVPLGVIRLHVPIVTHLDVEFYVSGRRLFLAPGEVWNLDTTYRHGLANNSTVQRVHLIIDFASNDELRTLLPHRDAWDMMHDAYFWLLCCGKGFSQLAKPRALTDRIRKVFQLRIARKSSL